MTRLPGTDLEISSLCLGTNVFGWTVDEAVAHALLDRFVDGGGRFLDTADVYSSWADGNVGGESERIIGQWIRSRRSRDAVTVATKVGLAIGEGPAGLNARTIVSRVEDCLARLQTDVIDLLFAHRDDPSTPLEETLEAFTVLIDAGKVRFIAASNYTASRLRDALAVSDSRGFARYCAVQEHYSLVHRKPTEPETTDLCLDAGISLLPYFGLEKGFLTGKYRPSAPKIQGERAARHDPAQYLDDRGVRILAALDDIAAARQKPLGAVALAWLLSRPTVPSVLASARTVEQLDDLLQVMRFELAPDEAAHLTTASATDPGEAR
jgi:aryl-alcohol dehydrogenase-like predicted oxidoreductase